MSRLRNPFRLRASERIESDTSFLRIYNPTILESLSEQDKDGKLWNNVLYIHSSPGAGKTSLLRVFEPDTLLTLLNNKSATDYKLIFSLLKKMDVLSDSSVNVLGVSLVCTRNYEILEDLDVSSAQRIRYFFSLLNARIILSTLRAIVKLINTNESYDDILNKIIYTYDNRDNFFSDLTFPCSGKELYHWASKVEKGIHQAIDSFLPLETLQPTGHDELFSLSVLQPQYFQYGDKRPFTRVLFMFDDSHKLSSIQRRALKKYIIERRGNFTIWISERLEALEPIDNLRSFAGRDYEELNLEKFWGERPSKFESTLANIADKRAAISSEEVNAFREYLDNNLEEEKFNLEFKDSIEKTKAAISKIASYTNKFDLWIAYVENQDVSPLDKAILYKKLEILIHRNVGKSQLAFEFPLTEQELTDKFKSDIEVTSKLFLSQSSKIPYYFGFSNLVKLASNNIEQFLSFSADMFEQMLSNRLLGHKINVETREQEKILHQVAENKWTELNKIIPQSSIVMTFLTNLGESCRIDTFKPNAPYTPGVTGFAIKTSTMMFKSEGEWFDQDFYASLVNVISTCVAFNLLETKEVSQGEKGSKWEVYYLNRWLCLKFGLPFGYGGWRHRNTDELLKWLKK